MKTKRSFKKELMYFFLRALRKLRKVLFPKLPIPIFIREGGIILYPEGEHSEEQLYLGSTNLLPYEYWERSFIFRFLQPGMTFFDIGANYGFYTIIGAKRVGRNGHVHSFEPAPLQFQKLIKNIKINRIKNVKLNKIALADKNGEVSFHVTIPRFSSFGSLLAPVIPAPSKQITVYASTLDEYVREEKINKLELIKIDVEGAEILVFNGADITLRTLRPVILCEINDRRTAPFGYLAAEIIKLLNQYNYKWFELDPSNNRLVPHPPENQYQYCNLIATPIEKVSVLKPFFQKNSIPGGYK